MKNNPFIKTVAIILSLVLSLNSTIYAEELITEGLQDSNEIASYNDSYEETEEFPYEEPDVTDNEESSYEGELIEAQEDNDIELQDDNEEYLIDDSYDESSQIETEYEQLSEFESEDTYVLNDIIEEPQTEEETELPVSLINYEEETEFFYTEPSGNVTDAGTPVNGTTSSTRRLYANGSGSIKYGDQLFGIRKQIYDVLVSEWTNGECGNVTYQFSVPDPVSFVCTLELDGNGEPVWVGKDRDPNYAPAVNETFVKVSEYVQAATDALKYDYPSTFWFDFARISVATSTYINDDGDLVKSFDRITGILPVFYSGDTATTAKSKITQYLSSLNNAVSEINSEIPLDATTAKKVKIIHDYIAKKGVYNEDSFYSHTAYGILGGNGRVVCEGYAKAFKALCDEFGIDCILVPGVIRSSGELHGWNYVRLDDGNWYVVDVTWDDTGSEPYLYLLAGSQTVGGTGATIMYERQLSTTFSSPQGYNAFIFTIVATAQEKYHEFEYLDAANPCEGELYCDLHEEYQIEPIFNTEVISEPTCTEDGVLRVGTTCSVCGRFISSEDEPIEAEGHEYGPVVRENIVNPTCTNNGSYYESMYCTVCKEQIYSIKKTIPAKGHKYDNGVITTEPTCTQEGVITYTCQNDNTHKKTEAIPANGHANKDPVIENNIDATCESDGGYDSVIYCNTCNAEISREHTTINALGHSWDEGTVTVEPKCETDGIKTYVCSNDESHKKTETIKAKGHKEAAPVKENEVAPTCDVDGHYDEVVKCENCGKELSRNTVTTPKTGHNWSVKSTTQPTCELEGEIIYECTNDNTHTKKEVLQPKGHKYGEGIRENEIPATCETGGSYDYVVYCETCNNVLSRKSVETEPLGHKWVEKERIEAGCENDGKIIFECEHNKTHTKTETLKATGHTQGEPVKENVVEATCAAGGSYDDVIYCTKCKKELSRTNHKTSKLNHIGKASVKENQIPSTCEKDGSYDEVIYCKNCNLEMSRKTVVVKATGHNWDEGQITKEPTCNENGEKTYTCKNDATHKKTEVIKKLQHIQSDSVKENEKAPTCSKNGSYENVVYCKLCNEELSRKTIQIQATGHEYGPWETTKEPTALEAGEMSSICRKCGDAKKRQIQKLSPYVKLNVSSFPIKKGQSTTGLKVSSMQKGDYIESWHSNNSKIATVSSTGKIKGKKAGKAKITVTLKSGVTASCIVKVQNKAVKTKKVKSSLNGKPTGNYTLKRGESIKITTELYPFTSKEKIKYSSSKKSVATVSGSGVIKAKKSGSTVITIKSGTKSKKIKITVL